MILRKNFALDMILEFTLLILLIGNRNPTLTYTAQCHATTSSPQHYIMYRAFVLAEVHSFQSLDLCVCPPTRVALYNTRTHLRYTRTPNNVSDSRCILTQQEQ